MGKRKDITGQKIGSLTAIQPTDKRSSNGSIIWLFHCDCGNKEVYKSLDSIRYKDVKCPLCCKQNAFGNKRYKKEKVKLYEIGSKVGRLTIKEVRLNEGTYKTISYICSCDCGSENVEIKHKSLYKTRSCGCLQSECAIKNAKKGIKIKDITDYKFGKLTAVRCLEDIKKTTARWEFSCDCGNTHIMSCHNFLRERAYSCGCITSICEEKICNIFMDFKIDFKKQVYFDDLLGINGGYLRFDFGVYNEDNVLFLLEYDGYYHYNKTNLYYKNTNVYDIMKEHDLRKNEYCKNNNIVLYRLNNLKTLKQDIIKILKEHNLIS